jgi:hypothetical protein
VHVKSIEKVDDESFHVNLILGSARLVDTEIFHMHEILLDATTRIKDMRESLKL